MVRSLVICFYLSCVIISSFLRQNYINCLSYRYGAGQYITTVEVPARYGDNIVLLRSQGSASAPAVQIHTTVELGDEEIFGHPKIFLNAKCSLSL